MFQERLKTDETVFGGSKVVIEDSVYSGDHSVIRIDDEQFKYQVSKQPESDTYTQLWYYHVLYLTDSKNVVWC